MMCLGPSPMPMSQMPSHMEPYLLPLRSSQRRISHITKSSFHKMCDKCPNVLGPGSEEQREWRLQEALGQKGPRILTPTCSGVLRWTCLSPPSHCPASRREEADLAAGSWLNFGRLPSHLRLSAAVTGEKCPKRRICTSRFAH